MRLVGKKERGGREERRLERRKERRQERRQEGWRGRGWGRGQHGERRREEERIMSLETLNWSWPLLTLMQRNLSSSIFVFIATLAILPLDYILSSFIASLAGVHGQHNSPIFAITNIIGFEHNSILLSKCSLLLTLFEAVCARLWKMCFYIYPYTNFFFFSSTFSMYTLRGHYLETHE